MTLVFIIANPRSFYVFNRARGAWGLPKRARLRPGRSAIRAWRCAPANGY
jgi:hypothetical protein